MTSTDNVTATRRLYEYVQLGAWDRISDLLHPKFVFYPNYQQPHPGVTGFIASEKKNFDSCPGFRIEVLDTIADGDKVGVYLTIEGVVAEAMLGITAPGREFKLSLFNLFYFKDGLIIEKHAHFDRAFIKAQLTREP